VLDPTSIGSLEYAVAHLHVPLLVIKGHEGCGAVTAAVDHPEAAHDHIVAIMEQIVPAVTRARQAGNNGEDLVEAATDLHLKSLEATLLRVSPVIRKALDTGALEIVVAKYYLHAGQVQPLTSTF
jgi:carbonic anhydrase